MITAATTQEIKVAGVEIKARDCSIDRSEQSRIATMSFAVEKDVLTTAQWNSIAIGATVSVAHAAGVVSITETGTIAQISEVGLSGATIRQVVARTDERLMQDIRVIDHWENMAAGDVATAIVAHHPNITAGTINDDSRTIEEVVARYDSLYDCLEQIRQQTGLAWRVTGGQLDLFPPESRVGPAIGARGFITGTMDITTSTDELFNVARMFAWEYQPIEVCTLTFPCSTRAPLPLEGTGWEVFGDIVESPLWFPEGFKIDPLAKEASWEQSGVMYPFYARFTARRAHWVEVRHAASIATYGRRDMPPISDNGGISVDAAFGILERMLEKTAVPRIEIAGLQPTMFGHDVDSVCSINGTDMRVVSVKREWDRTGLVVTMGARND